jgi:uncharacterized protein with HEPN domain
MPRRDVRKYLFDVLEATRLIHEFTEGCALQDYLSSALLRSAVERQFGITGDALA